MPGQSAAIADGEAKQAADTSHLNPLGLGPTLPP